MGLVAMATLAGCKQAAKVTALVGGPDCKVAALEVEYDAEIDPASVCADAYKVEGEEVAVAKAVDPKHVIVVLKGEAPKAPKPECCKPDAECCQPDADCCKPAKPECCEEPAPKPECCDKPEGKCDKPEAKCDKPEGKCEKPEAEKCDKCKAEEPKAECCDKPEGKGKKDAPKIEVPKIGVQQVADIKTLDGKTVKAWGKAVKATDAKPFKAMHGHRHGHHHGEAAKPECCKPGADCCKPDADCCKPAKPECGNCDKS